MRTLKRIDGTAPAPSRGLQLALYETIEAIGDNASIKQIHDLLPAAITDTRMVMTYKKLKSNLQSAVYRGYLVVSPDDRYSIAPLSYYQARQEYLGELSATKSSRKKSNAPAREGLHQFSVQQAYRKGLFIGSLIGAAAVVALINLFWFASQIL